MLSDTGAWTESSWYDISNSWNAVEIDYQALITDGNLTLWLNDVRKQSIIHIDNDTRLVGEVRLGAQGIETGTRGTVYFDDFESRRFSYIGILPDPGVYDPQATNPARQAVDAAISNGIGSSSHGSSSNIEPSPSSVFACTASMPLKT